MRLLGRTGNLRLVQRALGHASIASTVRSEQATHETLVGSLNGSPAWIVQTGRKVINTNGKLPYAAHMGSGSHLPPTTNDCTVRRVHDKQLTQTPGIGR